ncbi:hypothetical protein FPZ12_027830 [Amycolatopsis acidicola]|uniref:Uncharacterized protein n=1 Tax=Amycolatopsis acidicola TaxID=2596893 RepID=A0A5N0UW40_9PSEU|nr:hypothetical protein [Amycolatopsis acidicola]KAA9156330.1 hypothetical protein FPZ12_027830 [Amycolatopsis acidicola]
MSLKPGARYWATNSPAAIVVVRPPSGDVKLTCGGEPLADTEQPAQGGSGDGVLLGKRYTDPESGLEVLCTRAGAGVLAADGRPLELAGARKLPASD